MENYIENTYLFNIFIYSKMKLRYMVIFIIF